MRGLRNLLLVALLVVIAQGCTGCSLAPAPGDASATPTPAGHADARTAVTARSTIDQTDNLKTAYCTAMIREHDAQRISDDRYGKISIGCDAVASALNFANSELDEYIDTGTLDAQLALKQAMKSLADEWLKLSATKNNGGGQ